MIQIYWLLWVYYLKNIKNRQHLKKVLLVNVTFLRKYIVIVEHIKLKYTGCEHKAYTYVNLFHTNIKNVYSDNRLHPKYDKYF